MGGKWNFDFFGNIAENMFIYTQINPFGTKQCRLGAVGEARKGIPATLDFPARMTSP